MKLPLRQRQPAPRILCCYANGKTEGINPETMRSVKQFAPGALFIDTSETLYAYGKTIAENWTAERDLIIIEHDMVITEDVISSFASCKKGAGWCTYSYQGPSNLGYIYTGLGCVRFSRKLQKRFYPFEKHFVTYELLWYLCDEYIRRTLQTLNFLRPHVHGHLEHQHDYSEKSHPEFCTEKQADGLNIFRYRNNPDGTRGEFVEALPVEPWRR